MADEENRNRWGDGPITESDFPDLVDMVMKILIFENSTRSFKGVFGFASTIKGIYDFHFDAAHWANEGKPNPTPVNPFKLIRKNRGRPSRGNSANLEPYGKVRGQLWLN